MLKKYSYLKENSGYLCISLILVYYSMQFSIYYNVWMKSLLFIGMVFGVFFLGKNLQRKKFIMVALVIPIILVLGNFDTRFISIYLFSYIVYIDSINIKRYIRLIFYINFTSTLLLLPFGYTHINGFSMQLGIDIMLAIIVYQEHIKKKYIVGLMGLTVLFYLFSNVSQFLICMLLYLALFLFKDNRYGIRVLKSKFVSLIFVFSAMSNILFALFLHDNVLRLPKFVFQIVNSFSLKLDELMNYRLSLTQISLNLFGVKLFGNVLDYTHPKLQDGYFNVDSGYVQLLQTKGLIVFIFMLILFTCIIYYFQKKQMYTMVILSIVLAFWGINEDIILSTKINIILLYAIFSLKSIYSCVKSKKRSYFKNGKSNT